MQKLQEIIKKSLIILIKNIKNYQTFFLLYKLGNIFEFYFFICFGIYFAFFILLYLFNIYANCIKNKNSIIKKYIENTIIGKKTIEHR